MMWICNADPNYLKPLLSVNPARNGLRCREALYRHESAKPANFQMRTRKKCDAGKDRGGERESVLFLTGKGIKQVLDGIWERFKRAPDLRAAVFGY
jgi:hypothetical protein